jgi:hypothetical protein
MRRVRNVGYGNGKQLGKRGNRLDQQVSALNGRPLFDFAGRVPPLYY